VGSAREELIASDEERQRPAIAYRFVKPHAEDVPQRRKKPSQPGQREPAAAKVSEHLKLEHIERRVSSLGEAACLSSLRADRGKKQPPRIPPLQLSCGETGHRRDLTRRVVLLEPHTCSRA